MDVFFFDSYYTRYLETLWVKIIDSVKKDDHSPNVQKNPLTKSTVWHFVRGCVGEGMGWEK